MGEDGRPDGNGRPEGNGNGNGRPEGNGRPDGNGNGNGRPEGNGNGNGRPDGNSRPDGNGRPDGNRRPDGNHPPRTASPVPPPSDTATTYNYSQRHAPDSSSYELPGSSMMASFDIEGYNSYSNNYAPFDEWAVPNNFSPVIPNVGGEVLVNSSRRCGGIEPNLRMRVDPAGGHAEDDAQIGSTAV